MSPIVCGKICIISSNKEDFLVSIHMGIDLSNDIDSILHVYIVNDRSCC